LIGVYKSKSLKPVIDAGHMHFYQIIRKLGLVHAKGTGGSTDLTAFESAVKFADQLDRSVASPNQEESNHRHTAPSSSARGPRPGVPVRPSIQQYSVGELAQLMRWIASDGQLRTDDEIMDEMVATLGFSRRGARIESAIRGAISHWRAQV